MREQTAGRGPDRVIELTGAYPALHQAIRVAGVGGTVVAAGFYQGPATALALGEEFHHNRVSIVCLSDRVSAAGAQHPLDQGTPARDRDEPCVPPVGSIRCPWSAT